MRCSTDCRGVLAVVASLLSITVLAMVGTTATAQGERKLTTREQQVVDLLKAIETSASGPVAIINPNKYIQHNLSAANGLARRTSGDRAHSAARLPELQRRGLYRMAYEATTLRGNLGLARPAWPT